MKYHEVIEANKELTDDYSNRQPTNPSLLPNNNFLMCPPFSYHATEPNNVWMQKRSDEQRIVNIEKAFREFQELYQFITSQGAFVHLMPVPEGCRLQDLVFCANAGICLFNTPPHNNFIVSNFTSPPRYGETEVIKKVMDSMGYRTIVCPHKFEGEADLKFLHSNVYIGGYGIRSEEAAYDWMEETFDIEVIKVRMKDEHLYHLDCSIFPITCEDTLVCTELYDPSEIREIEMHTNIIDIDVEFAYKSITNCVRLGRYVLNMSMSGSYGEDVYTHYYQSDTYQRNKFDKICAQLGLEPRYFSLSEYVKGGAALSCLMLHLNSPF